MSDQSLAALRRKARHRAEAPLLWLCGLITFLAAALYLGLITINILYPDFFGFSAEDKAYMLLFELAFVASPLLLVGYRWYRRLKAAHIRSNAVCASDTQFPALFKRYQAIARQLGIAEPPQLYVASSDAALDEKTRQDAQGEFTILPSGLVKLTTEDPAVVDFALVRILAPDFLGHTKGWRSIITVLPDLMRVPGRFLQRAENYSVDRLGVALYPQGWRTAIVCDNKKAVADQMDWNAFHIQCEQEGGSFLVRVANSIADQSALTIRYLALAKFEQYGEGHYGPIF
ncbi:MAG: hypothetical protein WAZ19_03125 [Anaerolineae bacterium]